MITFESEERLSRKTYLKHYYQFILVVGTIMATTTWCLNLNQNSLYFKILMKIWSRIIPNLLLYFILHIIKRQEKKYKWADHLILPLSILSLIILYNFFLDIPKVKDGFMKGILTLIPLTSIFHFGVFIFRKFYLAVISAVIFFIYFYTLFPHEDTSKFISSLGHLSVALGFMMWGIYYMLREGKKNYELRRSIYNKEYLYRQFMNSMQDAVVIISMKDLEIVYQNEESKRGFLGLTSENYTDQCRKITRLANNKTLLEDVQNASLKRNTLESYFDNEFQYIYSEDTKLLNITLLGAELFGGENKFALIIKDVTEKMRSQEQRIGDKYKNQIFNSLSHEIRTPLNGIVGMLQIMKDKINDPEIVNHLEIAESNSFFLQNELNDILDFGQILNKKFKIRNVAFSIQDLFSQLVIALKPLVPPKDLEIRLYISEEISSRIYGDESRISQILSNFLSNALKYTSRGRISLICEYISGRVRLGVEDTGIGMDELQRSSLFEMNVVNINHSQTDRDVDVDVDAPKSLIGMGLTISQRMVREMGSSIQVLSSKGNGTKFFFDLGYEEAFGKVANEGGRANQLGVLGQEGDREDNNINNISLSHIKPPHTSLNPPTHMIAIVDDNSTNRFILRGMLSQYKNIYTIYEAEDGLQAVELIRRRLSSAKNSHILVFMDLNMPVMDGIEATTKIREMDQNQRVKIIMVTAFTSEKFRIAAQVAGAKDFYTKPVRKDLMLKAVQLYLP